MVLSIARAREEKGNISAQFAKTMVIDGKVAKMLIQMQKKRMLMWQKKEGKSVILLTVIMHITMLMFFWSCRKKRNKSKVAARSGDANIQAIEGTQPTLPLPCSTTNPSEVDVVKSTSYKTTSSKSVR